LVQEILYFFWRETLEILLGILHAPYVVMEVSQNYTSIFGSFILVIFPEIFIHAQELGCGQGGKHKRIFWVCGWICEEVCKIFDVETYNAQIEKASNKIDTQKWNDQLLSLGPEKSNLE
jgi:hypothetical protein